MKILTEEEISAHYYYTLAGGIKGALAGLAISGMMFKVVPIKFPRMNPARLSTSIKTAAFILPPTALASICAEEASNSFDRMMYSSGQETEAMQAYRKWKELPLSEKVLTGALDHRYKIIVGCWAASLYASWHVINKDPYMTTAQKAVQARMYAQGLTVMLLLGSIGLSMWAQKIRPPEKMDSATRLEKLLKQAEQQEEVALSGQRSNEDRVKGKIFRYD